MRFVRAASFFLVFLAAFATSLLGQAVGQGLFSKVAGSYTVEFLPKVDIRQFFSTPYPTLAQAQTDDFGTILNNAFVFAGTQGARVDLSGIAGYQLYANSNPYAGLAGGYGPCIVGGPVTVTTSAIYCPAVCARRYLKDTATLGSAGGCPTKSCPVRINLAIHDQTCSWILVVGTPGEAVHNCLVPSVRAIG